MPEVAPSKTVLMLRALRLTVADMQPAPPAARPLVRKLSDPGKTATAGAASITAAVLSQLPELSL